MNDWFYYSKIISESVISYHRVKLKTVCLFVFCVCVCVCFSLFLFYLSFLVFLFLFYLDLLFSSFFTSTSNAFDGLDLHHSKKVVHYSSVVSEYPLYLSLSSTKKKNLFDWLTAFVSPLCHSWLLRCLSYFSLFGILWYWAPFLYSTHHTKTTNRTTYLVCFFFFFGKFLGFYYHDTE